MMTPPAAPRRRCAPRAPASSRPTIPPAPERKRPPSRSPSPPARSRRWLCTAPRRARRPRRATDRPRPRRSSSSGTLCARRGSLRRLRAPGARVLTASSGGTTWRSTRPAAGAGASSLRRPRRRSGCSACAGVCAPRTPPPDSPRARSANPSGPPTSTKAPMTPPTTTTLMLQILVPPRWAWARASR